MNAAWQILLVFFLTIPPQQSPDPDLMARAHAAAQEMREKSIHINELLGNLKSQADAQEAVDLLAEIFADQLPPRWATTEFRKRIAKAEYESASNSAELIPEQRIANVWKDYVRELGAPNEFVVTAAEIHSLRDGQYISGLVFWNGDLSRTVWTMPSLWALGTDGKVANGCRAIETMRVVFDMDSSPESILSAREDVRNGIVLSDQFREPARNASSLKGTATLTASHTYRNQIREAEQRYVRDHGILAYYSLVEHMFNELLPQ
jgi:hypothetical protein